MHFFNSDIFSTLIAIKAKNHNKLIENQIMDLLFLEVLNQDFFKKMIHTQSLPSLKINNFVHKTFALLINFYYFWNIGDFTLILAFKMLCFYVT